MSMDYVVQETHSEHNLFNRFLPFDIVVKIISYLDQPDCLACTKVCRGWYLTIPQYAQGPWSKLEISPNDKSVQDLLTNKRWQQFLGGHVKHIVLQDFDNEQQLFQVIQKLIDLNCTETEHLGEEKVGERGSNNDDDSDSNDVHSTVNSSPISLTPIPLNHMTHLTQLYFETPLDIEHGLVPILQRSPQLEFLSVGSVDDDSNTISILDLKQLFIWCPKLIYLEINPKHLKEKYRETCIQKLINDNYSSSSRNNKNASTVEKEKKRGLCYFLVCEKDGFGPKQIGPFLHQHADTLEFLALCDLSSQHQVHSWVPVFQTLRLPKLHTLDCDGTQYTDESIRSLVSRAPRLEKLTLDADHDIHLNLAKLLKAALQLQFLRLGQLYLNYYDDQDDKNNNNLSQQPSSPITQLYQQLDLYGCQLCDIFFRYVISVNDEILDGIAQLSRLESLTIHFTIKNVYTDAGLTGFLQKLGGTRIKTLKLLFIRELTIPMLSALADLQFLEAFETCGKLFLSLTVDGPGLVKILETSTTLNSVHLQYLHLTNIDNHMYGEDENRAMSFLRKQLKGYKVTNWAISNIYNDITLQRKILDKGKERYSFCFI
ncbi:hypothetical protein INT45_010045 [Circinella minor]|uniref:F-box domain-containing protein n=1 Tax=Circinella minor TaxID=1195481 RepID=A0A8H7S9S4_9FUNG|nr:hypothetical protein INT45_010045 [Circinella minor]